MNYEAELRDAWAAHRAPRASGSLTIVSLFSGCGGSSLGYSMAGFRELLAVERDARAADTFRRNFPEVPLHEGDITALHGEEALRAAGVTEGALDVLDGSPPCQGFSLAGNRMLTDPRNQLFREYTRLLRAFRPRALIMENVAGLVVGKMRPVFAEITKALKAEGYAVMCRLLDARWLGVPQARRRLIWIGFRSDTGLSPVYPTPRGPLITVREALGSGPAADGPAPPLTGKTRDIAARLFQGWSGARVTGGRGWHSSRRLKAKAPACTVEAEGGLWKRYPKLIHPTEMRGLSVGEVKRLQSFPDEFILPHPWAVAWAQIGNSVPPLMMRAIAVRVQHSLAEVAAERGVAHPTKSGR